MEMLKAGMPAVLSRYAPQRDLLLIFADLLCESIDSCSPERLALGNESAQVMAELKIEPDAIIEVLGSLGMAAGDFTHGEVTSLRGALDRNDYFEHASGARTVALAKLGQTVIRAFFTFARDGAFSDTTDVTLAKRAELLKQVSDLLTAWAERKQPWYRRLWQKLVRKRS